MTRMLLPTAIAGLATLVLACGSSPDPAQTSTPAPAPAPAAASAGCEPLGDLQFVCGLKAPEDIVVVPGTRFLVASGMQPGSGLSLVDTETKSAQSLFMGGVLSARADQARYASCPGPLDPAIAVLHGLSLRGTTPGRFTLYATNHGGRESVEVFELNAEGATPTVTWVGCALMPDMLQANSVAAFSDGTLVATVLALPGRSFEDIFAGRKTGMVYQWTPGSAAFVPVPGTELSGNNGIETSPDDREFYVAASGGKQVVAFSRANPRTPLRTAQLAEFAPDNVRLVGDALVAAGMIDAEPACGGAPKKPEDIQCPRGYIAVAINPQTMAVREIARGPAAAPYSGTATAIQVGNTLWLTSFNADRLAYRTLAP